MMSTMQALQLFDHGEYLVITVDTLEYTAKEAKKYLWKVEAIQKLDSCLIQKDFEKRARSLLVVVTSPTKQNYDAFLEKVRNYTSREPFNFQLPPILMAFSKVSNFVGKYSVNFTLKHFETS
ncbi:hypothetical protein J437_LFUL017336 [Ladona fulva]|uniref:Uncharacterized protein n=1 Tax=Ladona fulva TaxID=123851 RepID=A0A8K0P6H4_LADFU|nr:hypothetical protein J437_LFUL017336 [Ladona fulva]